MKYANRYYFKQLALSLLLPVILTSLVSTAAARPLRSDDELTAAIHELLEKTYKADEPGAAVIVVKDGKTIFRKGYGKANLELGVPIEPDMIFRIGSITKQFTAVAILMLAERGKLSLDDDFTKYLPDYPAKGQKITIAQLLNHTSGIKSYTSLPEWRALWRKDLSLNELIDTFKDKPMDFAPGEKWSYNNSAYVLLGAIIEKVSGQSYKDFVEKQIFAPLGMKHSFYDDTTRVIPRRVPGYSKGADGWVNAPYLSMSHPHAAGALVSSVDDLAIWDAALYTDKLLKQETLKQAWTPLKLNNGKPLRYGFGWTVNTYEGHRVISHGGGINGFITYALRMPDDRVFVSVLTNKDSGNPGPDDIALKIAALVIGKPQKEPVVISLPPDALDQYVGVYQLDEKEDAVVRREGDKLFISMPGAGKFEIAPMSETEFFVKGPPIRLSFTKDKTKGVTALTLRDRYSPDRDAVKTDKPLPAARQFISLDPAIYDRYAGEYELSPGLILTVSRDGDKLMAQGTGQPKIQLWPESQTKFYVKEIDAQVEFVVDGSGKATSLLFQQGPQKLTAKRVK
ncbi:MAG TPA: serine hydrolase [Blastocatellia bacterium]|nr:serine hydrolase [Blastocatellia bacterium]